MPALQPRIEMIHQRRSKKHDGQAVCDIEEPAVEANKWLHLPVTSMLEFPKYLKSRDSYRDIEI